MSLLRGAWEFVLVNGPLGWEDKEGRHRNLQETEPNLKLVVSI